MRYRKLTKDGDYSFGLNASDYTGGPNAVALAIKSKILLFYGEWWENRALGIPIFQSILGQVKTDSLKIALFNLLSDRIKEIPQVISIDEISIDLEKRVLAVLIRCTVENNDKIEVEVSF